MRKWFSLIIGLIGLLLAVNSVSAYGEKTDLPASSLFLAPLPATKPDPSLVEVPFFYGKVITEQAPIYSSIDAAKSNKANQALRILNIGLRKLTYVSYQNVQELDNKKFYEIGKGEWMSGNDLHKITPSSFQGLVFWKTPTNDFGWIVKSVQPSISPGEQPSPAEPKLPQYKVVPIMSTQKVGDVEWTQIGIDKWVESSAVGRVMINPQPPKGINSSRWIEVNLMEQTLSVYENKRLIFATLVSSGGEGHWTRPGIFQIREKKEAETMKLYDPSFVDNYLLEDVPWTMYFDQERALHGAYWHNYFGLAASRGCVNLSNGDAHWLYNWAKVGDYVYVWDPSGKTPTDPSLYDKGGA